MDRKENIQRRDFLKTSAAAMAGATLAGGLVDTTEAAETTWTNKMPINPDIDNLRVVYVHDTSMITIPPGDSSFASKYMTSNIANQTQYTDSAKVQNNLDRMAMTLLIPKYPGISAKDAWGKIFRSSRSWSTTRVAIKPAIRIDQFMVKIAIIQKVCNELVNLGVQPSNIIIYDQILDGGTTNVMNYIKSQIGSGKLLPAGIKAGHAPDLLGPKTNMAPGQCWRDLTNGSIDILVNLGRNQEHANYTSFHTGLCKSHYGTFSPMSHGSGTLGCIHDTIRMFKSEAITGGTPPRQQFCIVDATVGSVPYGGTNSLIPPTVRVDYLVMGTCAPIVDYLVIKKIRQDIMKINPTPDADLFCTELGYSTSEPQWVVAQAPVRALPQGRQVSGDKLLFSVRTPSTVSEHVLNFPQSERAGQIQITDLRGRFIRSLNIVDRSECRVVWDGRTDRSVNAAAGTYIATLICKNYKTEISFDLR